MTSAIHSRDDTARPDEPGSTSRPGQTSLHGPSALTAPEPFGPEPTSQPFGPDDTALDLRTPRSPAPGDSDGAHQQILKNVIKAQLFPEHAVPVTIGRFRVLRPLGAGGMSVVYAAYDEKLDRRIALKLLRGGETPDSQPRLLREAQAMARLAHPNVVAVHEVGTWNDQVYVAMEFVKGRDLRTWLAEAPQHHADVVEVFTAAGRGLAAAHHAGIVHRDFKPANVLLGDDGRVRVVDFGLARTGNEQLPDLSHTRLPAPITSLTTSLTMTGALVGTPAYMSPEQHAGRLADARSDQFSFCVALWEGLYGVTPFAGQTLTALAEEVVAGRIAPVPEDSNVPAWLRRVLLRGLAVDPAARWPSMDDLLDELARDPEKLRRARLRIGLVAAGIIAVFLGLAWLAREQADLARLAQRAEAAAEHQRNVAEQSQADAEAQRDLLLADLKIQLAAKESARVELEQALKDADAARLRAEDAGAAAEAQSTRADQQRQRAEREAAEAQRQTTRAVQEARRARDATRLSQALGGAQDDPTTVLALLRETEDPAATPGWIPAAVDTLLQPVSQAVLRVHRGTVHAAGFTAGGRRVATAADDHTAALWDWTADTTLTREHPGPVKFLAFGPDDLWVSASADGRVLVGRGSAAPTALDHPGELRALALAPNGHQLATAGADGRVRVWDLTRPNSAPRELRGHTGAVLSAMFDRAGRRLVTAAADGTARIWDTTGVAPPRVLDHPRGAVRVAVWSAGDRVATGAQDGSIRVWNASSDAAPILHSGHTNEVVALAFSPDDTTLLSASLDGTARIWPSKPPGPSALSKPPGPSALSKLPGPSAVSAGKPRILRGHTGRIYSARWSPNGDRVLTASQDGTARVWPTDGGPARILRGHAEELGAAEFSPGGDHVVTAGRDGNVRVWQVRGTGEEVPLLRPGGRAHRLAWTPAGDRLVSARDDGVLHAWRPEVDAAPRRLAEPGPAILALAADASTISAVRSDGLLLRWPVAGGEPTSSSHAGDAPLIAAATSADRLALATHAELWYLSPGTAGRTPLTGHTGSISAIVFTPGGGLLTGATDRTARVWDLSSGPASAQILGPHSGGVTAVAVSPDGRSLATGAWDKRARVWSAESLASPPVVLAGHTGPVWSVAFSPDGDALATASDDHSARVWPLDDLDDPVVLTGHTAPVRAVAFRPDGAVLASAGDDGTIRLWNADFSPAALQARLRRASPVCLSARQRIQLLGEDPETAARTAATCAR